MKYASFQLLKVGVTIGSAPETPKVTFIVIHHHVFIINMLMFKLNCQNHLLGQIWATIPPDM